jgi:hypothetical protein
MSAESGADAAQVAAEIAELRRQRAASATVPTGAHRVSDRPVPHTETDLAAREIERLRALRVRRRRDTSIGEVVTRTRDHASSVERRLGRLIEAWETVVPGELAARTAITSLRGGVVHVTADSSPVAYEVNRLLREGGLTLLRSRTGAAVARVKVTVGRSSSGGAAAAANAVARRHAPQRNSGSS